LLAVHHNVRIPYGNRRIAIGLTRKYNEDSHNEYYTNTRNTYMSLP